MKRLGLATVGVLAVGLMLAGTARAAITGSTITTPADLTFSIADLDADSTFAISGTTTGANATDKVDIRCYSGTSSSFVRGNVPLNPDGSFSVSAGLAGIDDGICRLRAIPAGTFPSDLTPFAGPRVATGERTTDTVAGGPNAGVIYDFYIWGQQRTAAFEYDSLGDCGLFGGDLFDAALEKTTETFNCNAWFDRFDAPSATRSGLRIDGADAYPPAAAARINGAGAGLPGITYSYTLEPGTGNLAIHVSEPLVRCADATYPPTIQSCATFVGTGVTDTRTISQGHDGHVSTITDVFSSTDGAAHALDLLWENDQRFHGATGDSTQLAFQFPGQSGFSKHDAGEVVALPAAPGTILIHMDGAPDGDPGTGQGAIVYDRPADSATFIYSAANVDEFNLHQTGTVPAGGSTTFRFAYAQDYTATDLAALTDAAADPFGSPTVRISSPANGALIHASTVTVGGTAIDNVGVSSLTVAGHAVALGPGGAWSTAVALSPGANTIAAVAHDAAGDTGEAQIGVTYQPATTPPVKAKTKCKVPRLTGKTLKAAKKALDKAHCRAGKVTRKRSRKIRKGRVISTEPHARTQHPSGTKVKITLSKGR